MIGRAGILGAGAALAVSIAAIAQDDAPSVLTVEECTRILEVARAAAPANLTPGVDVRGRPVGGADLAPGVDVRGRPVAPAGPAAEVHLPEEIEVPITARVFDLLSITPPAGLANLGANAGVMSVRLADGRVTFNGQVLGAAETAPLVVACTKVVDEAPPLLGLGP